MKTTFKCSYDEFFLGCRLVIKSMEENLEEFGWHKTFYDAGFVANLHAELDALEMMPDEEQRQGQRERLRVYLKGQVKQVRLMARRLDSYIEEAFEADEVKSAREEAGMKHYLGAKQLNWEDVKGLLNRGASFIAGHGGLLTSEGGMPGDFVSDFGALRTDVLGKISVFLGLRQGTKEECEARVVACNKFYRVMRRVMKDGQIIFDERAMKRDRFVWERVLRVVTPAGAAGLRGVVKDGLTLLPVGGVVVELRDGVNPMVVAVTNGLGRFDTGNLPVGVYAVRIVAEGYAVIETEVVVKVGVVSYRSWLVDGV